MIIRGGYHSTPGGTIMSEPRQNTTAVLVAITSPLTFCLIAAACRWLVLRGSG